MAIIKIKPLSVNEAYRGRRFKTKDYESYEWELFTKLKPMEIPEGKLQVFYKFGLSNHGSDGDNCIKQFQDILSKKYGFNDNKIYKWVVEKEVVKKGEEFIEFNIQKYE